MNPEYENYLRSKQWQIKRIARLKIDNGRCQFCGTEINVQVHHVNYKNGWGNEDIYNDLITLCDKCHNKIHTEKVAKNIDHSAVMRLVDDFILLALREKYDVSDGGKYNLNKLSDIKQLLFPFLKERGVTYFYGSGRVQSYFCYKKEKIIKGFMEKGYSVWATSLKTGFSYNMVKKAYERLGRGINLGQDPYNFDVFKGDNK